MNQDDRVLEVLCFRRHTGAALAEIRSTLNFGQHDKHTPNDVRQALRRLADAGTLVNVGEKWFFTPAGNKQAKGPALKPEWQRDDPWILLAALYCRDQSSIALWNIISVADAINREIPTLEQLHGALNRLVAGRLMKAKRDTFTVTNKARELFEKVRSTCRSRMLDHLNGLQRILECPCCGVKLAKVGWTIPLDSDTLNAAIKIYYDIAFPQKKKGKA